jgi:hypothetical protein
MYQNRNVKRTYLAILGMQILDKIAVVTLGIRRTESTASMRGCARVETKRGRGGCVNMANMDEIPRDEKKGVCEYSEDG